MLSENDEVIQPIYANRKMVEVYITGAKVKMPAGTYMLGDPCYHVPDDRWSEWLDKADSSNYSSILVADLDGKTVLGFGTQYGDGSYSDQYGNVYGVDAGLIGLVPIELCKEIDTALAKEVEFDEEFICERDNKGQLTFGNYIIKTEDWNY
jgi:hypothetical protein